MVQRAKEQDRVDKKARRQRAREVSDFMSTDVLTKPFNYVSGMVSTKDGHNPLSRKKKSGILNVLSR